MTVWPVDWSGFWWSFLLIYGLYTPCLLTMLEQEQPLRQRLFLLVPCLLLSWPGYWLSQRYLKDRLKALRWADLTKN